MHTKPTLPKLHLAARFIAASIATTIAVAMLTFVTELFQRDGADNIAYSLIAERAKSLPTACDDLSRDSADPRACGRI
ncbi:MAG TPA: hypothetical protein VGN65_10220 [Casimicrobiaceae bacterium]|jgi:hypothetical protein